jgi:uncharacterized membrane protein
MYFAMLQVVDKGMGIFTAFWRSICLVFANFYKLIALYLYVLVVFLAGVITLLVGLVWALPYIQLMLVGVYDILCCGKARAGK